MIKFLDLKKVNDLHGEEIKREITDVINSGWYLHGNKTEEFEKSYAK